MIPRTIRIQRLVLHGVAPHDCAAVVAAFRAELARLVADGIASPGAAASGHAAPGPGAVLPAPADAGAAGRAAAGVVARAIGGAGR